jgi:hypothetical protein
MFLLNTASDTSLCYGIQVPFSFGFELGLYSFSVFGVSDIKLTSTDFCWFVVLMT